MRQEGRCGHVGWWGGKGLIKITELSALRAVRQQGLDGGVGVATWGGKGGKGLIESDYNFSSRGS